MLLDDGTGWVDDVKLRVVDQNTGALSSVNTRAVRALMGDEQIPLPFLRIDGCIQREHRFRPRLDPA